MDAHAQFIYQGRLIAFHAGDSVLIALQRVGIHPAGGGCLCLRGDCPHCLAVVDGVAYVRTCQTQARAGLVIEPHPRDGYPPLPPGTASAPELRVRHAHADVAVVGLGEAGRAAAAEAIAAGKRVVELDARHGEEVIGIYAGPLVIARTAEGMLHVHAQEVIVATGAAEIHPVAPGNDLAGLYTARASAALAQAGIGLGRMAALGPPPADMRAEPLSGDLVRFEGEGRVRAVVMRGEDGLERRVECDAVSINLGLSPRDALVRMGAGLNVRAVGDAARPSDLPTCPAAGVVCPCSSVSVDDLQRVWDHGFRELELVKRATLAGTGTCQGSVCIPHLRSFLKDRGGALQPPFTARPVTRQLTLAEAAAGAHHRPTPRTALHHEHLRLGARMDRVGGWWRPWTYGKPLEEYWAVREAVSLCDVSTLGKMQIAGPDALAMLERLYPTKVASIAPGRARYVLMLDERGYVMDDGLVCNDGDGRYSLTFTSGGASHAEMWLRDWAESWGHDVRLFNQTMSLGAINVTGPLAHELLARAGLADAPKFMQHARSTVAGIDCRVLRLSFTGEISFELHHPAEHSATLWRRLLELGADLGIKPHGLETMLRLRLEKGHVIVGQDTDFDSTARRIGMDWAVKPDKEDFVGKRAVERTNRIPLDKQLVGFEMAGPAPLEGECIWVDGEYAGYVTSSTASPALGKAVMLGWLKLIGGALPDVATIAGRTARRVPVPFYDKEGARARA